MNILMKMAIILVRIGDIKMTTPVIFRKFKEGDVIALFPTIPYSSVYDFTCYQHIGQHSGCEDIVVDLTKLCQPEEYQDLLKELIFMGYDDLIVRKKITYKHFLEREKLLNQ